MAPTGVWTLGNISNSTVHTLTIQAIVKAPQNVAGEYENAATINGTNVVDGQLLNNVATVSAITYDPLTANNSDSLIITRKKSYLITNPMIRSRVH